MTDGPIVATVCAAARMPVTELLRAQYRADHVVGRPDNGSLWTTWTGRRSKARRPVEEDCVRNPSTCVMLEILVYDSKSIHVALLCFHCSTICRDMMSVRLSHAVILSKRLNDILKLCIIW